ncbi:uncharacterized protein LOC131090331 [Melospiza georgiana]|uniref:uncharacterized protein LOC131090331 n=1 Tax=Melospiza georgiana TaxID=44398 RepID=UPI0025AD1D38|nr:uncharacterized protein LOC131090331 [Melospiza georgiana]
MAEEVLALREQLLAEATCPLCLDVFEQPVLTACGHSFCGQCLAAVLGDPPRPAACPQCRAPLEPGSQRPIRSLGNVAGLARSLEEVAARPRCPQHGEALALFCDPCAALLCAPCRDGPEHRGHRVRPAEEAARELQKKVRRNLLYLQGEKKKLNHRGDQKSEDLQQPCPCGGSRSLAGLRASVRCLAGDSELEQMSHELVSKSEEYRHRVLERQSLLDTVIAQIQEKREQPAVEFLKDVGTILSSCEAAKAPIPEPVSPELQKSIQSLTWKSQQVVDMVDKFRVNLRSEIDWGIREQVTLDPETANPHLILSKNCKTVRLGAEEQNVTDTPKRFTHWCSVLGTLGFTSGRHYWDVEVGEEGWWAVGVALESVPRKELLALHGSEKVWALQEDWRGQYSTISKTPHPLALRENLQRIRVCLDYEMGRVTFYDAKDLRQILQLEATFTEKVFPYFLLYLQETQVRGVFKSPKAAGIRQVEIHGVKVIAKITTQQKMALVAARAVEAPFPCRGRLGAGGNHHLAENDARRRRGPWVAEGRPAAAFAECAELPAGDRAYRTGGSEPGAPGAVPAGSSEPTERGCGPRTHRSPGLPLAKAARMDQGASEAREHRRREPLSFGRRSPEPRLSVPSLAAVPRDVSSAEPQPSTAGLSKRGAGAERGKDRRPARAERVCPAAVRCGWLQYDYVGAVPTAGRFLLGSFRLFHSIAAMAEEVLALREQLLAEATCPLCLDVFEQPVLTACGHSFCGQCLAAVLGDPPRPAACPQCRAPLEPGSQRPIRSLGNVAGLARSLEEVAARPRCPQHGKALALFCEPCAALLCAPCRDGPEHRGHRVRPAEEAARELQETLQRNLLSLQEQKEKLKSRGDRKSEHPQVTVILELRRAIQTYEELQQCLEEQKKFVQVQLVQMSHELVSKSEEYTRRVLERQSLLDTVIAQIQEKREQPAVEFLKDVGTILSSCEAVMAPIPVSPELQKSIQSHYQKSKQLMAMVDKFRVNMCHKIDWQREQVTLDPETAHPRLLLSDANKAVWFRNEEQNLLDTPKRFTGSLSVLGSQGFTSGRHYWEVEVRQKGSWAVGVALESVPRKEPIYHGSSEKTWVLQLDWGHYSAQSMSTDWLVVKKKLKRIRVCLHYEMGLVTFYNAKNMMQIFQFKATFTEKVFPYFSVSSKGTHIRVCH